MTKQLPLKDDSHNIRVQELDVFFERMKIILFYSSFSGRPLSVNKTFARVLGYSDEEFNLFINENTYGFINLHHEDSELINDVVNEIKKTGGERSIRSRHICKDGSFKWISWNVAADSTKQIIISIGHDITKFTQIEENLRHSEEKFSKVFQENQAMMGIYNQKNDQFVDVNKRVEELTGYSREDIIGKSKRDLFWVDLDEREDLLCEFKQNGFVENFEYKYRKKSGEIGSIIVSINTFNVNGTEYVIASGIDVTKRKQAENELRKSEELFAKAFQSNPTMMVISRFEDSRFIDVNNAWLKGFGFSREEAIGRNIQELNLCDPDLLLDVRRIAIERGETKDIELTCRTKNGKYISVITSVDLVELDGEHCFLSSTIDITEQKQVQEKIARLDRLNLVGAMAATIGHEIRNPMTAVRGFLQMLSKKEEYYNDHFYFELMIEELDRANGILSEYLSMARDKKIDLKPKSIDSIVASLLPIIESEVNSREMNIALDLHNTPPMQVDENEIRQMILNITRNGLEAMTSRGTLTLGTRLKENEIILFIKDEGHGMSAEILDKLGTPFLTSKENGTGLGLAVCYSIAVHHNARIDIQTSSEGTTFNIIFPFG